VVFLALLAVAFCAAPVLAAPQWSPTGSERAHTVGNPPGIEWDTGGLATNGNISYSAATQTLTVGGIVDVLNYYDPADGSCSTDSVGSNCSFNYSPDLSLDVKAQLTSIVDDDLGGGYHNIIIKFETSGDPYDLLATDSSDGDSVMLEAVFTHGLYLDEPTSGLSTTILFNGITGEAIFESVDVAGFLQVTGGHHESLFANGTGGTDLFGLAITSATDFVGAGGNLDQIVGYALTYGTLPDFTAEAEGQAYRVSSSDFEIPEPSTGLLLGFGLSLIAAARRRS